jgi:serine/threonine-protein kinase
MPSENLTGLTIAGYRLLERVGEGGTADVYHAQHPQRGSCAFKVLRLRLESDPTSVTRFVREAGYGERVVHPGVVRTFEHGEEEGRHYLALEWAPGKSLGDMLLDGKPLPAPLVATVVSQLAEALAAAHAVGIIHRDLKPENIMYDAATQTAKLLDFGIARDAAQADDDRLTRTGFFVGSLDYVAPEARSGELVDERADIYGLASITYYLLTRCHPHTAKRPRELFHQLLTAVPVPLNSAVPGLRFSDALQAAVMRGLERDPAGRQPTVTQFAADVRLGVANGKR